MMHAMRIAVAGKGGTGKTTISATLARWLARQGRQVLAIDADSNPNLAFMLGLPAGPAQDIATMPRDVFERRVDAEGVERSVFAADPEQLIRDYGVTAPDDVRLLVMGRVGHGGAG